MRPQLLIDQKLTFFVNRYEIFAAGPNGLKSELLAFAQQKRFKLRENITFYSDETQHDVVFTLRAEKVLDIHGRYFVEDASGKQLGILRKQFKKSLVTSTWQIEDAEARPVFEVTESNKSVAVLRRVVSFIPIVGEFIDLLFASLLRFHFDFIDLQHREKVGKYRKVTVFRDRYVLDMTPESYAAQDWRVYAAMGVALDALQSR